jgi:hypothetical protein
MYLGLPQVYRATRESEQKGFLERSLADFLNGHPEEAVRIATTIRVLVHEGGGKPLLKSFKPNYLDLPILDNAVHYCACTTISGRPPDDQTNYEKTLRAELAK